MKDDLSELEATRQWFAEANLERALNRPRDRKRGDGASVHDLRLARRGPVL